MKNKPELLKVYKRNGLNCVDMNGTYTYLPDDPKLFNGIEIDGEMYTEVITVNTSV